MTTGKQKFIIKMNWQEFWKKLMAGIYSNTMRISCILQKTLIFVYVYDIIRVR
ncbi:MAG: hypothetical protein ISS33_00550 [Candidatus Omnitrophica bacterium]|nr:hypothetical protein [Candidatus Omnitrophota bacterium]